MRIYADVNRLPDLFGSETHSLIVRSGPTPPVGSSTPLNGQFVVPVPEGVELPPLDSGSRLLDPAGPVPEIYNRLLGLYPQFGSVVANPLLNSADLAQMDFGAVFPNPPRTVSAQWESRYQAGRAAGPVNGHVPLTLKILPVNRAVTPERPGMVVTDTIDITAATGGAGASQFLVWWKVYSLSLTHDVQDYGVAGENSPALKSVGERDPTMGGSLEVYLSPTDGAGYSPVRSRVPVTTPPATRLRIAWVNRGTENCYLAAYALLF